MKAYQRRSRLAGSEAASSKSTVTDSHQNSGLAILKRRRAAARRMPPYSLECSCPDGWNCRCTVPPLSDNMIDASRDAALHILENGQVPLIKIEMLQALWRRGGEDRELAELLHQLTAGQIA
jgi:hypothetical protein